MKFSSAGTYDAAANVQHQCFDTLTQLCDTLTPKTVLDLGCGTGTTTLQLTSLFPNATITAIDHSEDMLNFAKTHNTHPNISYVNADIATYTPENPVDLILSNAAFQWLDAPETQLDRYTTYLSKVGTLALSYFGPETFRELRHVLDDAYIKTPLAADSFTRFSQSDIVKEERITTLFPSFIDLLKHIKNTGTRPSKTSLFLTPGLSKRCDTLFRDRYAQVKLTYQALFCIRKAS